MLIYFFSVGIALPTWLLDAKFSNLVLVAYVIGFAVIVPGIVIYLTKKWKKNGSEIKVREESIALFNQIIFPDMDIRNVIEIISGASKKTKKTMKCKQHFFVCVCIVEFRDVVKNTDEIEHEIIEVAKHLKNHKIPDRSLRVPWSRRTIILIYFHLGRVYNKMPQELAQETANVAKVK